MSRPGGAPPGMPPHLWELAKRDVRTAIPERLRRARTSGAEAPARVRQLARRAAGVAASAGAVAAAVVIGQGFAGAGDVTLAGGTTPLGPAGPGGAEGFDGLGGGSGGGFGGGFGGGSGGGSAGGSAGAGGTAGTGGAGAGGSSATGGPDGPGGPDVVGGAASSTGGSLADGPVESGLGTSFRVQESAEPGSEDWLEVEIFQDVSVTETADGMFLVQAVQVIVIRDDDGNEYVFREIHQVTVPDPPGQETDLFITQSGYVHVIENPDGSFTPVTTDYELDVAFGSDGDGFDEVTIDQDAVVRLTDREQVPDDDVGVVLSSRAVSTSDDTGDEATSTIFQDQVLLDGEAPPGEVTTVVVHDDDPFGPPALTEVDGRSQGTGTSGTGGSPATTGTPAGAATLPAPGGAAGAGTTTAAPLASSIAAPAAAAVTAPVWSSGTREGGPRDLDDLAWGGGGEGTAPGGSVPADTSDPSDPSDTSDPSDSSGASGLAGTPDTTDPAGTPGTPAVTEDPAETVDPGLTFEGAAPADRSGGRGDGADVTGREPGGAATDATGTTDDLREDPGADTEAGDTVGSSDTVASAEPAGSTEPAGASEDTGLVEDTDTGGVDDTSALLG
ncbi:hypothetical protein [Actinomycetospora cinnamomea]|uniref:Uncharacterized protein n=1 Tax=Actinomycetospora cinnamomea TaxID=663609 RepID=A0A2U1F662_9PSEU|nr:hypothetical protein [Actinomycetospora cinnamomea]PVZ07666.1 hypothetical protein C8D89_11137 [Actinomycetospora cinnamomea]